ncbi:Ser/Thr protein phosphatase family protein [Synechococcus sp. PCC 7335]|uniref:metallophosphoesterase family protein n=1 Tax=Synechococcus sp. (strain ATCC 29403 / PCC 7335) TaxID=91464 RepID=UPI00017EE3AA|nr:exonuclease SbcCD subunit D [Synechococcus sp. PCC 7335]EDX87172.1 Ser/Thr protein phosphatase family protein [Synechococcus sp. PCC 7335]
MAKFLHVSDIHLGFDRYDSKPRTLDFFYSFKDVLEKYAVGERVDFVIIGGDLFEHRNIKPAILNQAQLCFQVLKDASIPVLAIEGNHDNAPYGTKSSWLRYLSDWGLLKLLEPGDVNSGEPFYSPWDEERQRGGYIDLDCGVRVLGSSWYGAAAPRAIEQIAAAMDELPEAEGPSVLLFHHGLEGQIARYSGALRYSEVLPLKKAGVDYLALGHIHKNYCEENWIFNPGSIEANNVEESQFERGAYLVEIDQEGTIRAELKTDYHQRPIVRLQQKLRSQDAIESVEEGAIAIIEKAINSKQIIPDQQPIIELRITGTVGFDRLELDTSQLQRQLQERCNALIFLLRYDVEEDGYISHVSEDASRSQVEQEVFIDLLCANSRYKKQAETLAHGLIDLKTRQMEGESEDSLYSLVETILDSDS